MGKVERFPVQSEFSFFGSVNEKSLYRMGLMGTQTIPTPVERLTVNFPANVVRTEISETFYTADENGERYSFAGRWWRDANTTNGFLVLENQLVRHNFPVGERIISLAKATIDKTTFEDLSDIFEGYVFVKANGRLGSAYRSGNNWVVDENVYPPRPMNIRQREIVDQPTDTIYLDEIRLVCLIQEKSKPYLISGLSNFFTFEHDRTIDQRFNIVFDNRSDPNFFNNPADYWIYPYVIKAGAVFALNAIDGASVVVHNNNPNNPQKKFTITIPNNNDLLAMGVDFVFRRNPSAVFNTSTRFLGVISFGERLVYWTTNRIYITDAGTLMTWGTNFEATEGVGGYVNLKDIITCKEVGGQLMAFTPYGVFAVGEVATGVWGVRRTELPAPVRANNRWFITRDLYYSEVGFIDLKTRQPYPPTTKQLETIMLSADGTEGVLLCLVQQNLLPSVMRHQPLFLVSGENISAFPLWDLKPDFVAIQGGFMIYGTRTTPSNQLVVCEWLPYRFVPFKEGEALPKETRWIYERSFQQEVYLKRWGLSLRLIDDAEVSGSGRLRAQLRVCVFSETEPTKTYWVVRPLKAGENRFAFPNRIRGNHFRFTLRVGFETNFGSAFVPTDEPTSGGLMDFFDPNHSTVSFRNDNITRGDYEITEVWYEYVALERSEGGMKR